jgi:hypothetical protein
MSDAESIHCGAVALVVDGRLLDHVEHPVGFLFFFYLRFITAYVFEDAVLRVEGCKGFSNFYRCFGDLDLVSVDDLGWQ